MSDHMVTPSRLTPTRSHAEAPTLAAARAAAVRWLTPVACLVGSGAGRGVWVGGIPDGNQAELLRQISDTPLHNLRVPVVHPLGDSHGFPVGGYGVAGGLSGLVVIH